jgi:hypothetical protein
MKMQTPPHLPPLSFAASSSAPKKLLEDKENRELFPHSRNQFHISSCKTRIIPQYCQDLVHPSAWTGATGGGFAFRTCVGPGSSTGALQIERLGRRSHSAEEIRRFFRKLKLWNLSSPPKSRNAPLPERAGAPIS